MKETPIKGRDGRGGMANTQSISIWTRDFVLLCLANLSLLLSMQAFLPTMPLYLLRIGGNQGDVGYVMGAYTLSAMFMRSIAGLLSDRYGRKKVMIMGLVMMAAVTSLYRLADSVSFVTILRVFHGIAFGLAGTALGTIVVDSVPTTRMSEGIGYYGLTPTISMSLAPMIGLWLVGRFGYPVLFTAVSVMVMLALFFGLAVRNTHAPVCARADSVARTMANLLERTALLPSLVVFLLSLVNGAMLFYVALYTAGLGIRNIGLFFATSSLCMAISRPISGRWADRGGAGTVMVMGFLTLFIGIAVISLSHTITGFLLAGAFAGLGFGFCVPTLQALAVRHAPPQRRGAATGTYFGAFDMGLGLGAILWGSVAEASGYRVMYISTLIPLALAGTVYYRFKSRMTLP